MTEEDVLKVVVVDSDPEHLKCLCDIMETVPCETKCFNSPEDALVSMVAETPDILLMNINMPVLNGRDLCSIVRSMPELQATPIVLISGDSSIGDFSLYFKGVDFMQKPIDPKELLARIKVYHKLKSMGDTLGSLLERRKK